MGRLHGWKRSPFGEKLRKAALVRSDLQDHEDSSRQVRKKSGDQRSKGFHASEEAPITMMSWAGIGSSDQRQM